VKLALRFVALFAVTSADLFARGYRSWYETFIFAALGSLLGSGCVWLYGKQRIAGIATGAVIALSSIAIALAYVSGPSRPSGPLAYREVEDVMAHPDDFVGDTMKLHGYVELGSVQARVVSERSEHAFVIHGPKTSAVRLRAHLVGPVPDTFAERADASYVFEANEVMAKCPSTYQTASGPQPAAKFR